MPIIFLSAARSVEPPAKSSKAFSVTRMMWLAMNGRAFGRAVLGCFRQHSHSSTAQLS
jgi:hypothetical protein